MDKKTGLVAFFDILGYQSFLEQNEPEFAGERILELMNKVKEFPKNTFLKLFEDWRKTPPDPEPELAKYLTAFLNQITYLIISDSIIFTFALNDGNAEDSEYGKSFFITYCSMLFNELFSYGFPVRGAIEYGDYILLKSQDTQLFAGRPIVDAYKSAMNLDLSACQISDSVALAYGENHIYLKYKTPLKTGDEKVLKLLMSFYFDVQENTYHTIPDLTQFVIDSFTAHKKMIDKNVQNKILNTELFLRCCKAVHLRKTFEG